MVFTIIVRKTCQGLCLPESTSNYPCIIQLSCNPQNFGNISPTYTYVTKRMHTIKTSFLNLNLRKSLNTDNRWLSIRNCIIVSSLIISCYYISSVLLKELCYVVNPLAYIINKSYENGPFRQYLKIVLHFLFIIVATKSYLIIMNLYH